MFPPNPLQEAPDASPPANPFQDAAPEDPAEHAAAEPATLEPAAPAAEAAAAAAAAPSDADAKLNHYKKLITQSRTMLQNYQKQVAEKEREKQVRSGANGPLSSESAVV